MRGNLLSFYWDHAPQIVCIWFAFWSVRRGAEADYPLNRTAKKVRWTAVSIGFFVGYYGYYAPANFGGSIRVAGFLWVMAFLCWPNLAYHLTNLFGRRKDGEQDGL